MGEIIDEDADHMSDPPNRRLSRRGLVGTAVVGTAAVAGVAVERSSSRAEETAVDAPSLRRRSALKPVVRYHLRTTTQGWTLDEGSSGVVSNDASGWLLARGAGTLAISSPQHPNGQLADWELSDRGNDGRLTISVQVDGEADTYPLVVRMAWGTSGGSPAGAAESLPLIVPTGVPVDIDTWWNCRGTAPTGVLSRVQGLTLRLEAGSDSVNFRFRDIRQPGSTAAWGARPVGVGTAFQCKRLSGTPAPKPRDAYQQAVLDQLAKAQSWGRHNHRAIHIGEWAWPKESRSNEDTAQLASIASYTQMAEQWMRQADRGGIAYTPWGESGYWGGSAEGSSIDYGSYPDASYFSASTHRDARNLRVVDRRKPSAKILEQHHNVNKAIPPSINVVGMCFTYLSDGSEYSSTNIGVRGKDYFSESPETIRYLYDRGYRIFRLPFRWDRVMRSPNAGELDPTEWGYVKAAIKTILKLPHTSVIVDVHSGNDFWISPDPTNRSVAAVKHSIDGPTGVVTTEMFVKFWTLMSRDLRRWSRRLIYEIANEPQNSNPYLVRRFSQAVVTALRKRRDRTFILIPTYPFDNLTRAFAETNLPFPFVVDPLGTRHHAYTLHHYMDYDQSGQYALTYAETLAKFTT